MAVSLADDAVDICSRLVGCYTTNFGAGDSRGERAAAVYAAGLLDDAGAAPEILESAPGRANVVCRIEGTDPGAAGLLVHGHLDVVPVDEADWSVGPFSGEVRDGMVWGRGILDMNGMIASALAAVRGWSSRTRRTPAVTAQASWSGDTRTGSPASARR